MIILTLFAFIACKKEDEASKSYVLGKYLYEDDARVLHCNSDCAKLKFGKDENGHTIYAKHPIDTSAFIINNIDDIRVCSRCVDDEIFERILNISQRNKADLTMPGVEL